MFPVLGMPQPCSQSHPDAAPLGTCSRIEAQGKQPQCCDPILQALGHVAVLLHCMCCAHCLKPRSLCFRCTHISLSEQPQSGLLRLCCAVCQDTWLYITHMGWSRLRHAICHAICRAICWYAWLCSTLQIDWICWGVTSLHAAGSCPAASRCTQPCPAHHPHNSLAFTSDAAGGAESILIVAGADATDDFNAIHSARAKGMLKQYIIGRVGASTGGDGKPEQAPVDKEVSP